MSLSKSAATQASEERQRARHSRRVAWSGWRFEGPPEPTTTSWWIGLGRAGYGAGVRMEDVLSSERVDLGDEKMLEFRAAGTFARIAGEAGWRTSQPR